jgi:hypothetical protein
LPGRCLSWGVRYRIYQGPDHLLQVATAGHRETYRRFYYRDIQAFVLVHSPRRTRLAWGFGIPFVLILLVLMATMVDYPSFTLEGLIGGGIVTLAFGVPLLANWAAGPSCIVSVKTAVQCESLRCLRRVRAASEVFDRLGPMIQLAQQARAPILPTAPVPTPLPNPEPPVDIQPSPPQERGET